MELENARKTSAVRTALQEFFLKGRGAEGDLAAAGIPYDEKEFLIKDGAGILWGRILPGQVSEEDIRLLNREMESLRESYPGKIRPHFFFPVLPPGISQEFGRFPGNPRFFEYFLFRLEGEDCLGLWEWRPSCGAEPPVPTDAPALTRSELADLIELSLELRK